MKLSNHNSAKFVKLLYIGDSGTGKTGSLVSLVKDGYDLRVLDFDSGLDILRQYTLKECPERIDSIDYESLRDQYKRGNLFANGVLIGQGPMVQSPKAYLKAVDLLTKWSDGSVPSEWGEKTILVIDSLSGMGKAAFEWARGMNPQTKDGRQWYGTSQASLEAVIAMLTSDDFHANVIIISHVQYVEEGEAGNSISKGYTNTIGRALGPIIPRYFNNLILAESSGSGKNVRRKIRTLPTGTIELKTSVPFKLDKDLDLGTGLAELFNLIKEDAK